MNCSNASVLRVEEPLSHTSPCVVAQKISYNYRVLSSFFFFFSLSCSTSPGSTWLRYRVRETRILSHSGPTTTHANTHRHSRTLLLHSSFLIHQIKDGLEFE